MDIKEINYILGIYRCGSMRKAAEELYISQPALSKFLKNIERQIGSPLFNRIGNDLVPTHIGNRYLDYAARIYALQDDWNIECSDLLGEEKGALALMMPPMRSASVIPYVLPKFYKKYPNVRVSLLEEANLVKKHWLDSRDIDFVIYSDTMPMSPLVHEELGSEEIVLVAARDHPLANRGISMEGCKYPWLDLRQLKGASFVLNPIEQTTGREAHLLLEQAGVLPHILMHTRNTDVAIRMAATGTALAFAPESYVKTLHLTPQPLCFSVGAPKTQIVLYAIYQHGRYIPSYGKYFLNLVREAMRHLTGDVNVNQLL